MYMELRFFPKTLNEAELAEKIRSAVAEIVAEHGGSLSLFRRERRIEEGLEPGAAHYTVGFLEEEATGTIYIEGPEIPFPTVLEAPHD